MLQIHLQAH